MLDNYSKVEELLKNYNMIKVHIVNLQEEIEHVQKDITLTGMDYTKPTSCPTFKVSSTTEDEVFSIMSKVAKLEDSILENRKEINKIDRSLNALDSTERTIVIEYYINTKHWWQISSTVCFSERHCRNLRRKAINKLAVAIFGKGKLFD